MGAVIKTGVKAHDDALINAERTRQASITAGVSMSVAAAADIAFARAALASCLANNGGAGAAQFTTMLYGLGVRS